MIYFYVALKGEGKIRANNFIWYDRRGRSFIRTGRIAGMSLIDDLLLSNDNFSTSPVLSC